MTYLLPGNIYASKVGPLPKTAETKTSSITWMKEHAKDIADIALLAGGIFAGLTALTVAAPLTIPLLCIGGGVAFIGLITRLVLARLASTHTPTPTTDSQASSFQYDSEDPFNPSTWSDSSEQDTTFYMRIELP